MTYIIAESCIDIKDKSCVDVCPVDCIHEYERILVIDPEECIDCGTCEPGRGDLPGGCPPRQVGAVREDQLRLPRGRRRDQPARRRVRRRAQRPERAARSTLVVCPRTGVRRIRAVLLLEQAA